MTIPSDLRYSETHQWARKNDDGSITVGITHHAQEQLGDLVYVQNPTVGQQLQQGAACAVAESVKSASEVYAPMSGEVIEINTALNDEPEQINADPYAAWLFKIRPTHPQEWVGLLDADAYRAFVESA